MSTLSDVNSREDGLNLPGAGPASGASPLSGETRTGVSVRCGREAEYAWYVIRVTYGREIKALNHLITGGIRAYLPMRTEKKADDNSPFRMTITRRPLVPNIIFARTTRKRIETLMKGRGHIDCITPYYDHFRTDALGRNEYLTVPDRQMDNFIKLTSTRDRHIRVVSPEECRFKSGDTVIVTDGKFKGITGRVARVGGQQRVVVTLDGVCSIATAYIPTAFITKYYAEAD